MLKPTKIEVALCRTRLHVALLSANKCPLLRQVQTNFILLSSPSPVPDSIRSIRTTYAQTDGWTGLCRVSRTRAHEQSSFVLFVERGRIHFGSFLSHFAEVFIRLNRLTRGSSQFRKLTAFCRKSRN